MEHSVPDPLEPFETWLLQRVAQAVEDDEVSTTLLTELQAELAAAHAKPREEQHALAIHELAARCGFSVDQMRELLETLEGQPSAARERFLRRFVEAWLVQQRELYDTREHGE